MAAIREGMASIVPVPLLGLMTGAHLEQLVCGLPNISISLLKQVVRWEKMDTKDYFREEMEREMGINENINY